MTFDELVAAVASEPNRTKELDVDTPSPELADNYVALSYHTDASAFVVLDVDTGSHDLMDACGADTSCQSHRIP